MTWSTDPDPSPQTAAQHPTSHGPSIAWLEDAFLEAYVCWREACDHVDFSYHVLDTCERSDRRIAFAAYAAALDREESAAGAYRNAADRLRPTAGPR
jgi:hypothetical protein